MRRNHPCGDAGEDGSRHGEGTDGPEQRRPETDDAQRLKAPGTKSKYRRCWPGYRQQWQRDADKYRELLVVRETWEKNKTAKTARHLGGVVLQPVLLVAGLSHAAHEQHCLGRVHVVPAPGQQLHPLGHEDGQQREVHPADERFAFASFPPRTASPVPTPVFLQLLQLELLLQLKLNNLLLLQLPSSRILHEERSTGSTSTAAAAGQEKPRRIPPVQHIAQEVRGAPAAGGGGEAI